MKYATKLNPNDTREAYAAELRRYADRGETPDLYAVADYIIGMDSDEIDDLNMTIDRLESEADDLELENHDAANEIEELQQEIRELKAKPKKKRTTTP